MRSNSAPRNLIKNKMAYYSEEPSEEEDESEEDLENDSAISGEECVSIPGCSCGNGLVLAAAAAAVSLLTYTSFPRRDVMMKQKLGLLLPWDLVVCLPWPPAAARREENEVWRQFRL